MLRKYKSAVAWGASSSRRAAKRRKLQTPTCGTCGLVLHRPFICLHCSYGGCWKDSHILAHMKDLNHQFCADVKTGSVFCIECDDMIADDTFEELFHATTLHVEEKETTFVSQRKRRETYKPWQPEAKDEAALSSATQVACSGRIGLLNLGQTCFLNVILQSFLHNPMLRNYFLSDMHNSKACKIKECMCCELDKLFSEVYSGKTVPFGPATLLATTWKASPELAGYSQQDAHEFFISALNHLHKSAYGNTSISCNCVVHAVFGGQLQSDHTCGKCGSTSSKIDPILDISMQLKGNGVEEDTLAECLRRFTHPETMTKYSCNRCGPQFHQQATKRLSIRKLPPVLSIQFKRFEHEGQNGKATPKKIDTHVRIPATLNMLPYTTIGIKNQGGQKERFLGPGVLYEYDLFAVVNHDGQIDTGHYTNYARSQDLWFRFDDDKVAHSSLSDVLKSTVYMCFYVKRHLDYKPFTLPTYKIARENEAVKEREKEKEKEASRLREVEEALLGMI
ncbi:cysteine proteinase [Fomitiporia mediterranea MF3/22]|uniref:cysteine proteinase n=1 Tax=Fomitiporia mediterranea (strain MF3/22) TaxID=694068 RepID=UPI0004408136|nr:cysteine proteinase [Fomitiporia mediterranea MF3/22]EJD06815.1 cysteine proteinase [Fomitiporia mediterranea MF3/22]